MEQLWNVDGAKISAYDVSSQLYKDRFPYEKGRYPFIPFNSDRAKTLISKAIEKFHAIHGRDAKSFVDLGCGIGNIILIAQELGLSDLNGIEIDPKCIPLIKQVVPNAKILRRDLLKWKPSRQYDIIWFYQPLCDWNLWEQFLQHFTQYAPKDQIFISPIGTAEFASNQKWNRQRLNFVQDRNDGSLYQII